MPELVPVSDADLEEFCHFLSRHLDPDKTPEQFRYAFEQEWGMKQPNHGFVVRKDGDIVGQFTGNASAASFLSKVQDLVSKS